MLVYQRVNLHFPMVFLWFSYDVPIFLWVSHGFWSLAIQVPVKNKAKECRTLRGTPNEPVTGEA